MVTIQKIPPDITANILAILLVLAILTCYGRQAMEWLMMKLHEYFIQHGRF